MQHPHARPAGTDSSSYGRRRTNSIIVPAVPPMAGVPPPPPPPQQQQQHHQQQHQQQQHQQQQHHHYNHHHQQQHHQHHLQQQQQQQQQQHVYAPYIHQQPQYLHQLHTPPTPPAAIPTYHHPQQQQQQHHIPQYTQLHQQQQIHQQPQQPQQPYVLPPLSPVLPAPVVERPYFKPPLPWYSAPGTTFPRRYRRRRKQPPAPVEVASPATAVPSVSEAEVATPPTTNPPSEVDSTLPTTPSSTAPPSTATSVAAKPAVPVALPKKTKKEVVPERKASVDTDEGASTPTAPAAVVAEEVKVEEAKVEEAKVEGVNIEEVKTEEPVDPAPPSEPAKPASWADLLKSKNAVAAVAAAPAAIKTVGPVNGLYGSLEEALRAFQIQKEPVTMPFLEPRGLVNTGNMCFMNAILQMLVFCGPFYYFLDRVSTSAKNFKDNTPLTEAMIMFMREFRIITKDPKTKIKSDDLEAVGEPFAPEFIYETIRKLKRFSHMRRGHQQDAEEFLGFILDGLHEEAVEAMSKTVGAPAPAATNGTPPAEESGWLEVGPKQKHATTRTTEIIESPITKIFGGNLRSVFSVPGLTKSVTLEPYTPLQLDIQSPEVRSVVDALTHLTTPEKIHGDFKSPKGPGLAATKQVFIESLPAVLILHLKRFQYDSSGGTQKIWKRIAYPLELDIPREAMSPGVSKRTTVPRYRLIGVVYHHGSSAQGGHYTVDVLRQDQKNWVRMDDTTITRVAPRDVEVGLGEIGEEEEEGWVGNWEQVNGSGSSGGKAENGKRFSGKESRTAYILFYQRI